MSYITNFHIPEYEIYKMEYRVMNYQHYNPNFQIKSTVDQLEYELSHTRDPMERLMIRNFIRIRVQQDTLNTTHMKEIESIESLSEEDKYDLDSEDSHPRKSKNNKKNDKKSKRFKELEELEKIKKSSMRELRKKTIHKAREETYKEMVDGDDTGEEYDSNDLESQFNSEWRPKWNSKDLNDPKYAKYVKEDRLNNKMMERLNSEIEFMIDERSPTNIVKPFDSGPGMNQNVLKDSVRSRRDKKRRR